MTQTLNDFVLSALSGEVEIPTAGKDGGKIVEYIGKLNAKDIEAISAEAINRDIVDTETTSWEKLLIDVYSIIESDAA